MARIDPRRLLMSRVVVRTCCGLRARLLLGSMLNLCARLSSLCREVGEAGDALSMVAARTACAPLCKTYPWRQRGSTPSALELSWVRRSGAFIEVQMHRA